MSTARLTSSIFCLSLLCACVKQLEGGRSCCESNVGETNRTLLTGPFFVYGDSGYGSTPGGNADWQRLLLSLQRFSNLGYKATVSVPQFPTSEAGWAFLESRLSQVRARVLEMSLYIGQDAFSVADSALLDGRTHITNGLDFKFFDSPALRPCQAALQAGGCSQNARDEGAYLDPSYQTESSGLFTLFLANLSRASRLVSLPPGGNAVIDIETYVKPSFYEEWLGNPLDLFTQSPRINTVPGVITQLPVSVDTARTNFIWHWTEMGRKITDAIRNSAGSARVYFYGAHTPQIFHQLNSISQQTAFPSSPTYCPGVARPDIKAPYWYASSYWPPSVSSKPVFGLYQLPSLAGLESHLDYWTCWFGHSWEQNPSMAFINVMAWKTLSPAPAGVVPREAIQKFHPWISQHAAFRLREKGFAVVSGWLWPAFNSGYTGARAPANTITCQANPYSAQCSWNNLFSSYDDYLNYVEEHAAAIKRGFIDGIDAEPLTDPNCSRHAYYTSNPAPLLIDQACAN